MNENLHKREQLHTFNKLVVTRNRTLQSENDRKLYIAPPLPQAVNPDSDHWTGRRIDYILYRESTLLPTTAVDQFLFITQLAGLSDHIPISLRLSVSIPSTTYL
ncbi:hypothetical protein GDO86_002608 [Hymenochirus boettgeri]|uniref:Uncharacterized protein n=1 Tax=Hymenochirus boettgeri TaxID=247094 RepID=A0A8T2KQM0_9PIPI|nr:hypothetical protein GDO86_002608 [Hymenochirus boettgeri]